MFFIDGCHDYEYVKHDSQMALKYTRKGGVIIWHDYGMIEDVSRYVDTLSSTMDIHTIRGCRLAIAVGRKFVRESADVLAASRFSFRSTPQKDIWQLRSLHQDGLKGASLDPVKSVVQMEKMGAGEIIINTIDRDESWPDVTSI